MFRNLSLGFGSYDRVVNVYNGESRALVVVSMALVVVSRALLGVAVVVSRAKP